MYTYLTGFYCKHIEAAERIARGLNPVEYTISKSHSKAYPHYVAIKLPLYASLDAIERCCDMYDKFLTDQINQNKAVATSFPTDY